MELIIALVVGGVCGWLAGIIMKSKKGILFNIILGIIGGIVGGFLFGLLNIPLPGYLGDIVSGVVSSCLVIFIVRLIKKK